MGGRLSGLEHTDQFSGQSPPSMVGGDTPFVWPCLITFIVTHSFSEFCYRVPRASKHRRLSMCDRGSTMFTYSFLVYDFDGVFAFRFLAKMPRFVLRFIPKDLFWWVPIRLWVLVGGDTPFVWPCLITFIVTHSFSEFCYRVPRASKHRRLSMCDRGSTMFTYSFLVYDFDGVFAFRRDTFPWSVRASRHHGGWSPWSDIDHGVVRS